MGKDLGKSATGLDANVAAMLSYLAGFITGIIFILIEKDNKFVRFHAMQSIIVFGTIFVLQTVFVFFPFFIMLLPLLGLLSLILWIVLMVKAYQGEMFKLPIAGDMASQKS